MAISTAKHSEEARAFWTLFKAMKPEIKKEVCDMILHENTSDEDEEELSSDMITAVSMESFQQVWNAPENEHWDDFIKERLKCTNKEI